jgi:hypothetical protein
LSGNADDQGRGFIYNADPAFETAVQDLAKGYNRAGTIGTYATAFCVSAVSNFATTWCCACRESRYGHRDQRVRNRMIDSSFQSCRRSNEEQLVGY